MASRLFGPPGAGLVPQGGDPFGLLHREVNRVFDEVFRGFPATGRGAAALGGFAPSLDVHETERGLEITAELPGMSEQDVELRLEGDLLVLAGEKRDERAQDQGGTHLTERSFGRFQRSFRLPFRPDPGQVQARFEHGVLHVGLPRPQQEQRGGRIQIQTGGGGGGGGGGGRPGPEPGAGAGASNDAAAAQRGQGQGKVA